ncbi:phage holin family protein [Streptomyces sp. NPDC008265]|uniref:phage holin family protein n=1 Tax=Streptomyces sp. NPDC008265 TaxID=3364824 RepID=UPI0036EB1E57
MASSGSRESPLLALQLLGILAGVSALAGRKEIARDGTPAPEQIIDSLKTDLSEMKEKAHR